MVKSRVLFVPHSNASFSEMLPIAEEINYRGKYSPLFLITWADHAQSIQICKNKGYQFQVYGVLEKAGFIADKIETRGIDDHSSNSRLENISSWTKSKLKKIFIILFVFYFYQFNQDKRFARKVLSENDVDCILLIGDRHAGIETALVRAGNRRGIPSLIVPFGFSDPESSIVYRQALDNWQKIYGVDSFLNRLVANTWPEWVYTYRGETMLWNPPAWLLAAWMAGILPKNPWILGGGGAWCMAVESQYHQDIFRKQGIPAQKIFVSGKPRYDSSAQIWSRQPSEKAQMCRDLDIDIKNPLLVCAVHQSAEHGLLSWADHWAETDFLFAALAEIKSSVNVLLSLHPKSDFTQYTPRAQEYGLLIARDYQYDQLVPVCDIYLASFSSTVTLAIACHKPTIVLDFYGHNYDIFDNMPGIVVCRQHDEFQAILSRVINNQDYYDQLVEGQAKSAEYWARFDGKSTQRILNMIDELVEKGREIQKLPPRKRRQALPPWSH